MHRLTGSLLLPLSIGLWAQTVSQPLPASDPQAITLAQQSFAALLGGATITDVTLNGNVTSIFGADNETGTGTFEAKGTGESRIDLNLSGGTRSDVRNVTSAGPVGAWETNGGTPTAYPQHNCWTDAAWFFPALSSLSQTANANFVFKYAGQQQHGAVMSQHIRISQALSWDYNGTMLRLSTLDFYLDPNSHLPLAVSFSVHADNDENTNIPTEIDFANYQPVNGVLVPFHFQQSLNGRVVLDVTVTSATFNSGLQDSIFTLQ
ncbi:MAG TPA: hypothetical protein VF133_00610 [Terriglobales bacterium]